jgi:activating signal cointegrator complex subunit 2
MSKDFYVELIWKNALFTVPKLFDIAVLFGPFNLSLVHKMISDLFSIQPKFSEELIQTIPIILCIIKELEKKFHKLSQYHSDQISQSLESEESQFELWTYYLLDITSTLAAFLKVYPESSPLFMRFKFFQKVVYYYETLIPFLESLIKNTKKALFKDYLQSIKSALLLITHLLLNSCFLEPLQNPKTESSQKNLISEELYILLMSLLQINETIETNDNETIQQNKTKDSPQIANKFITDFNRICNLISLISNLKTLSTM